ncbi:MAG: glycosyltransferase family 39 protein [Bacilli bacterium]|nr:glycosyltransferase family 39 protein [Bacilli bacterium]
MVDRWGDKIASFMSSKGKYVLCFILYVMFLYVYFFAICGIPCDGASRELLAYKNEEAAIAAEGWMVFSIILAGVYVIGMIGLHRFSSSVLNKAFIFIALNAMVFYGFSIPVNSNLNKNDWWVGLHEYSHWDIVLDMWDNGFFVSPPKFSDGAYNFANQYYQNKLWHYCVTLFAKFNYIFCNGADMTPLAYFATRGYPNVTARLDLALESIKIFQAMIGFWIYILTYCLFKHLGLKGWRLTVATGLLCLFPFYMYLPFIYNNDAMMLMWCLAALCMALTYRKSGKLRHAVWTAIFLGLGMMTKINGGLFAFPIAFIFGLVLYEKSARDEKVAPFFRDMAVFAVIVFPLGLWYIIYQNVAFGVPFGYVLYPGNRYSGNYIDSSFFGAWNRYIAPLTSDFFLSPYKRDWGASIPASYGNIDFNIWTGLFKSALFGDIVPSNFSVGPLVIVTRCTELIRGFWSLMIVLFFFLLVWNLFASIFTRRRPDIPLIVFMAILFIVTYANYVYFCIKFPFTSTMHFRYTPMFIPLFFYVLGRGPIPLYSPWNPQEPRFTRFKPVGRTCVAFACD